LTAGKNVVFPETLLSTARIGYRRISWLLTSPAVGMYGPKHSCQFPQGSHELHNAILPLLLCVVKYFLYFSAGSPVFARLLPFFMLRHHPGQTVERQYKSNQE
jgi:hypothetical protein